MKKLLLAVVIAVATWQGYERYQARHRVVEDAPPPHAARLAAQAPESRAFNCDGRIHCSQMTSCAEATYFLRNCPGTRMDGDNDGVPCEMQWCK